MWQYLSGQSGFVLSGDHTQVADLSSAVTPTRPDGAIFLMIQPLTQNVRITFDGTTPTASKGFQLPTGNPPLVIPVPPGNTPKVIEETASASLEYLWMS